MSDDPDLILARELAARHAEIVGIGEHAQDFRDGTMDDFAIIKVCMAAIRVERARIAAAFNKTPDQIRLAAGEMDAETMRTVQAVLAWIKRECGM